MAECGTPSLERPKANKENIRNGEGLQEILRVGWREYRSVLNQIPYSDVLDQTLHKIKSVESEPKDTRSSKAPEWVVHQKNSEALLRAKALGKWFQDMYGKGDHSSFDVAVSDKKLEVYGKGYGRSDKITKIYCTVPTQSAPEAFRSLFTAMVDEGVLQNSEIALNYENYQAESLNKSFDTNTIIIYLNRASDPKVFEKIAEAITRAKKDQAPVWQMSPVLTAEAQRKIAQEFMVPLDATTAFVEVVDDGRSYHAGTHAAMYTEISGEWRKQLPLDQLCDKMKRFTPQAPGEFVNPLLKHRRKYMPSLVFDKVA